MASFDQNGISSKDVGRSSIKSSPETWRPDCFFSQLLKFHSSNLEPIPTSDICSLMARLAKSYVAHVSVPKKTSQGRRKGVKFSSMNKSRKRSFKFYNRQGK